jgi:hypothetical protein
MGAPARGAGAQDSQMSKKRAQIHVEPKTPAVPYDQLPEEARNALADALLILAQRGREVLAGQVQRKPNATKKPKESR